MTTTTTLPSVASTPIPNRPKPPKGWTYTKKGKIRPEEFMLRVGYGVFVGLAEWLTLGVVEGLGVQNATKTGGPQAGLNSLLGYPAVVATTLAVFAIILAIWPAVIALRAKNWRQLIYLGIFAFAAIIVSWLILPSVLHWFGGQLATPRGSFINSLYGIASIAALVYVVLFRLGATSTRHAKIDKNQKLAIKVAGVVHKHEVDSAAIGEQLEKLTTTLSEKKGILGEKVNQAEEASRAFSKAEQATKAPDFTEQNNVQDASQEVDNTLKSINDLKESIDQLKSKVNSEKDKERKAGFTKLKEEAEAELSLAEEIHTHAERAYNTAVKALEKSDPMKVLNAAASKRDKSQAKGNEARTDVDSVESNVANKTGELDAVGLTLIDARKKEHLATKRLKKSQSKVRGKLLWWWIATSFWIVVSIAGSGGWVAMATSTFKTMTQQPGW